MLMSERRQAQMRGFLQNSRVCLSANGMIGNCVDNYGSYMSYVPRRPPVQGLDVIVV
jgi:hypothetical protein